MVGQYRLATQSPAHGIVQARPRLLEGYLEPLIVIGRRSCPECGIEFRVRLLPKIVPPRAKIAKPPDQR